VIKIDSSKLSDLDDSQQTALLYVLDEFRHVFSDPRGHCTVIEHEINVTIDFKPRMIKAYCVPETLIIEIEKQVDELLRLFHQKVQWLLELCEFSILTILFAWPVITDN